MFVAYLIPQENFALLEDGLQWIAKGETKREAEAALRRKFHEQMRSEFYTEQEAEVVWEQHHSYVTEV